MGLKDLHEDVIVAKLGQVRLDDAEVLRLLIAAGCGISTRFEWRTTTFQEVRAFELRCEEVPAS